MQFQEIINEKGERLWVPLLAGAAILTLPFWLNNNNNKCCNNAYYPQGQPVPYQYAYPVYQANYYPNYQAYPYSYPYPIYQSYPNINTYIR